MRIGVLNNSIKLALGLAGLIVLGQRTEQGDILIDVGYAMEVCVCPHCGRATNKVHDRRAQRKRDVPLRGQAVILILWRRRFRCLFCLGKRRRPRTFSEPDPACGLGPKGGGRRTTQRLRQHIAQELPHRTVKRVAKVYSVGQRFVHDCFAEHARREIRQLLPQGFTPRVLGLDEFSMKRGVRYETVLSDLDARRALEVVEGRDGKSVQPYLEGLSDPDGAAVVVMDMREAYRQVVWLCLPKVVVVVDRFHAVRRIGKVLDRVRLRLQRHRGQERRGEVYWLRYALLRDPADWTEKERQGIEKLFVELPELKKAWEHKEAFRKWYEAPDRAAAEAPLSVWEQMVREEGSPEYEALFAQGSMLGSWRDEILNYFDHRYTNGYVEGKNNRSKQLQRQAYGYSNRENLRMRILLPAA